jgi:L-fuconolactonase
MTAAPPEPPGGIVDAHHHLWDPSRREYRWLAAAALAPIRRTYTVDDLRACTAPAGVDATVLVQTISDLAETEEFLATAAASDGLVAGVVGWVDLTAPDVADQLDRLRSGPGGDQLVGVRHQVEDEPDPDWLLRPAVQQGLAAVGAAGLVYDLLVRVDQLAAARAAAERLPELRFVLDHAAKPPIAAGATEPWASELAALAKRENAACKLSGLVTEANWDGWTIDDLRPYGEQVLTAFGPERVIFGSDWPVCELAARYRDVVRAAHTLTEQLSPTERAAVFAGNARRAYRL